MDVLERGLYWLTSLATGADIDALCALESPVNGGKNANSEDYVLAQTNGDLVSVLEIRGTRKYVGKNDLSLMIGNFSNALEKLSKSGGGMQHSFSIGFRSDPAQTDRLIREILTPQMQTAKRLGINNTRMLIDRARNLASFSVDETVYLVVRTHKNAIQPHERETQADELKGQLKKFRETNDGENIVQGLAQIPQSPLGALLPRHQAAYASLIDDLTRTITAGGAELLLRQLSTHQAINIIRRHVDAAPITSQWRPRLHGDKEAALGSSAITRTKDASGFMPTRLSRQMMTSGLKDVFDSKEYSRHGDFWYGSVTLEIAPESGSEPFHQLAERLGKDMPWRVAFEIFPNGRNYRKMSAFLAAMLGAFSDRNKAIRAAFDNLRDLSNEGVYIGALRAVFTTWGKNQEEAAFNLANLTSAIESWGGAGCTNETGEPSRAMLASGAGFTSISPAAYIPAPMRNIAMMMPLTRPASIWDAGQITFVTLQGRPYPVSFGSNLQSYWATVGFAPTGSGKSFTLNVLNSGLLLAAGAQEVPPITLVDVGLSGKLVMDWYRSVLPDNLKHQVLSLSIRNSPEYTLNPFDTQHGFDEPIQGDVDFLVAVLGTLAPGCGPESTKFFERVIRVAYEKFSRLSPDSKVWEPSFDERVTRCLEEIGFSVAEKTRVWAVVDALFDAGYIDESISAQRYAMPTLSDIPKIATDSRVSNVYGKAPYNGEIIIDIFTRNIIASLDSFTILNGYTKLNIGAARAVSIDLQQVVGSRVTEDGRRKSGLMFLLARRLGARDYFLKWDEIASQCPRRYAVYQERRTAKLWETIKFLQYDEAHFFSGIESVTKLVHDDLRTGRKFNLISAMFSQLLSDFPEAVLENVYTVFIMGLGDSTPEHVQKQFALSNDEMHAITNNCTRPGTMFGRFRTVDGILTQILKLPASAYERFAFTTQGRDQAVRAALAKILPYDEALDLLADRFPNGTAEPYINKLVADRKDEKDDSDEALATQIAQILIAESLKK